MVIATENMHKVREFRSLLKRPGCDILSLRDFPDYVVPPETGATFRENAERKAVSAALALRRPVLADDSGLSVPALQGRPGIFSARYAGENATDLENRLKLLAEMQSLKESERYAYFECWIAIASPEGTVRSFQGCCEGMIIEEPRGRNGFGYDSVFRKHDYGKTFAELDEEVKNKVSHRRKALEKALPFLETLYVDAVLD